jgi:hypothetical protein
MATGYLSIAEPIIADPALAEPAVAQPVVAQPVVAKSVVAKKSVVTEQVGVEPSMTDSGIAEPVMAKPADNTTEVVPAPRKKVAASDPGDELEAGEIITVEDHTILLLQAIPETKKRRK